MKWNGRKTGKLHLLAAIFRAAASSGGKAPVIGLYSDYETDENGSYLFTAGQFVDHHVEHAKEIPASTYARFRTRKGPIEEVVLETWQQIWNWDQRYFRTYTGDFEWYGRKINCPKKRKLIFILVVDKK